MSSSLLSSCFQQPLVRFMLSLRNTNFSKFLAVRFDRFGLKISVSLLSSYFTVAEKGTEVLYLINRHNAHPDLLVFYGNMSGDRRTSLCTSSWVQEDKLFSMLLWDSVLFAAFMYWKVLGQASTVASFVSTDVTELSALGFNFRTILVFQLGVEVDYIAPVPRHLCELANVSLPWRKTTDEALRYSVWRFGRRLCSLPAF